VQLIEPVTIGSYTWEISLSQYLIVGKLIFIEDDVFSGFRRVI